MYASLIAAALLSHSVLIAHTCSHTVRTQRERELLLQAMAGEVDYAQVTKLFSDTVVPSSTQQLATALQRSPTSPSPSTSASPPFRSRRAGVAGR